MQGNKESSETLSAFDASTVYSCPLCNQIFTDAPLLESHVNEHELEVTSYISFFILVMEIN